MLEKVGRLADRLPLVVWPEEEAYNDVAAFIKPSARVKTVTLAVRSGATQQLD